jgi:hypothetical protein
MEFVRVVTACLELADDFAYALHVITVRNEHRIRSVDDHQILDADSRDDAVLGMDEGVARIDGHALTLTAVAFRVGFG